MRVTPVSASPVRHDGARELRPARRPCTRARPAARRTRGRRRPPWSGAARRARAWRRTGRGTTPGRSRRCRSDGADRARSTWRTGRRPRPGARGGRTAPAATARPGTRSRCSAVVTRRSASTSSTRPRRRERAWNGRPLTSQWLSPPRRRSRGRARYSRLDTRCVTDEIRSMCASASVRRMALGDSAARSVCMPPTITRRTPSLHVICGDSPAWVKEFTRRGEARP